MWRSTVNRPLTELGLPLLLLLLMWLGGKLALAAFQ
jgi:hypothetical protein